MMGREVVSNYIVKSSMPTFRKWFEFWKPKYEVRQSEPMPHEEALKYLQVASAYISYSIEEVI